MKVFTIEAVFELPDNFSGTTSDALRLLADYHQGNGRPDAKTGASNPHPEKSWNEFWNRPEGTKCVIGTSITEY